MRAHELKNYMEHARKIYQRKKDNEPQTDIEEIYTKIIAEIDTFNKTLAQLGTAEFEIKKKGA